MIEPNFNEEPFDWGGYDQIAHFRGGKAGRARQFVIGFKSRVFVPRRSNGRGGETDTFAVVEATFQQRGAQPTLAELVFRYRHIEVRAFLEVEREKVTFALRPGGKGKPIAVRPRELPFGAPLPHLSITHLLMRGWPGIPKLSKWWSQFARLPEKEYTALADAISPWSPVFQLRPYAIAPIRTRPLRTYDPRRETPRPEGEHVPMILARGNAAGGEEWARLQEGLRDFGMPSGLFSDLAVKRLGKKETDPFQLQVTIQGPPANLMDVGYGVSQALPVAVDCLTSAPGQILLMQQPEVHLHPRGQAELGTFLANLVKKRGNRFVVTHSDYLVDRVRLDIRDKNLLKPEDVCLLYCERTGAGVKVQEIRIDDQGNLVDAPPGYSRFFLEEEKRFFQS
jgi:hypothetical protein